MSSNTRKPMPIKIFYLKDDMKTKQPERQDKLSVTYLSSFIQNQKRSIEKSKNYSRTQNVQFDKIQSKYAYKVHKQNLSELDKSQPCENGAALMYNKWNKTKSKSHQDDQRMLTNIIGKNWDSFQQSHVIAVSKPSAKKLRTLKTIAKKNNTLEQMKRKKSNQKMLSQHFHTFLDNQQNKSQIYDRPQLDTSNFYLNKIDGRVLGLQKKPYNSSWADKSPNYYNNNYDKVTNKSVKLLDNNSSRPKSFTINPRVIFSSQTTRSGFKCIPNFEWSKLNRGNNFKLGA